MPSPRSSERAPDLEALRELPPPILEKLRALVSRVRRIQLVRGCLATLAVAALATIALMAIGATFTILSPGLHLTLSLAALASVLITAYRCLYLPLRRELSLVQMARIIEVRHPELHERISSAIELLRGDDSDIPHGSEQLLAQVVRSAVTDAEDFRPEREFTYRCSKRYVVALAAGGLVIGAVTLIFPRPSARLLARVVAPLSHVGNAYAERLDVQPGDSLVAAGDPLTVRVSVRDAAAQRAEIRRTSPGGSESVESLRVVAHDPEAGTTEFSITFPAIHDDFRYRIRCGRAVSEYFDVVAARRPDIRRLEVSYDFPAYTKMPPTATTGIGQSITAIAGTKIRVRAHFDRPLESAVLKIDGNPMPATDDHRTDPNNPQATWEFEMAAGTQGHWKIELEDLQSISNLAAEQPFRSIADRPPSIREFGDGQELRVRPDERLALRYEVDEDFGISSVRLRTGDRLSDLPQELPSPSEVGTYAGQVHLDVSGLAESGAGPFPIYLVVADNRPDPQVVEAGPITLSFDSGAGSLAEQAVDAQQEAASGSLESALARLGEAQLLARPIAGQLLKPDLIPDGTLADLARIQELTGEAEALVREAYAEFSPPSSLFNALAPALLDIAVDHLTPARQAAEEIPLIDVKVTRVYRGHRIARELDEGIADLDVAIRMIKHQTAQAKVFAKLSDLGERQRILADSLATASDKIDRQRLEEQQSELARAIGELAEQSQRSAADQLQDARQIASSLAEQAGALAGQQAQLAGWLDRAEDPGLREETRNNLGGTLAAEQREIAEALSRRASVPETTRIEAGVSDLISESGERADAAAEAIAGERFEDAAALGNDIADSLALAVASDGRPPLRERLERLGAWQRSLAEQADALARGRIRDALAARQEFLAQQAESLAKGAAGFRQRSEALADPSGLQQVQVASSQAKQAAQSARQASSQLLGSASSGAFEFAASPDQLPTTQNRIGAATNPPTQAGVDRSPESTEELLPEMNLGGGGLESPFSEASAATDTPPPKIESGAMAFDGGSQAPLRVEGSHGTEGRAPGKQVEATGQESIVSAAQQPALQAQRHLAEARDSLTNAAASLAQQANRSGSEVRPMVSPQMLEAVREAAELALENNPESLVKLANSIAGKFALETAPPIQAPELAGWQTLRGSVRSGVTSFREGEAPEEYRELVRSYFKEIARRANESPAAAQP